MANASAIFESLGANVEQLPLLWLAAPVSGLVIQPLVGYWSDRTQLSVGRRRPYFLIGAILSSLALVLMPNASALWVAAGALWLLDAATNVTMTPFRSFVADLVPEHQHTAAFSIQSIAVGLGAVVASALPWFIARILPAAATEEAIPPPVKLAFYFGAIAFTTSVIWTIVFSSKPFLAQGMEPDTPNHFASDVKSAIATMPPIMRQLAWVQCFSWLGMFCVFLYFPPAVAHNIFGATTQGTALYAAGIEWAGLCMALYNLVCCGMAFLLPSLTHRFSKPVTHGFCLFCGALGLGTLGFVHDQYWLLLPMIGIGIAFSSMLSLPYAMLMSGLPSDKTCLYTGIFNCFIVIPEIVAALGLGWFMGAFLAGDRLSVVILGGVFMAIGAVLSLRVNQPASTIDQA
ncbi:MAG: maltose/moltooligosaccharide transporter [Phormidesmis priestleyi Ana]|uniref:Maltose/moltooligosaccharide transporter n=1 Tax=Phormidesmis priestleyi Ana TaxID=1666911 RepID=A0A0P7YQ57_9CYAN|nr:MAG: maltose/moltooligosaccharide transporter [Phormidesmis priestleyi Ana]